MITVSKIKFKFIGMAIVALSIVLLATRLIAAQFVAPTLCDYSSNAIADSNTSACLSTPSTYKKIIYEIGLCKSEPQAPTVVNKFDLNNCTAVFKKIDGQEIFVTKGKGFDLSSDYTTAPPIGFYTHAYAILAPTIEISGSFKFQSDRTPKYSGSGTGVGTLCWSKNGTVYSLDASRADMPFDCGPYSALAQIIANGKIINHINSFSGFGPEYYTESLDPKRRYKAYLLTSDLKMASSADLGTFGLEGTRVERLLGVTPLGSGISVDRRTTGLDISFQVTRGATIVPDVDVNGVKTLYGIYSGPPSMLIALRNKRP